MTLQIPRGFVYWRPFDTLKEAMEYIKAKRKAEGLGREYYFNLTANEEGKFEVYKKMEDRGGGEGRSKSV